MKCAILDDACPDRLILERYCQRTEIFDAVYSTDDPPAFLDYLKNHRLDLVFIDVHLLKSCTFDIMQALDQELAVVFISADPLSAAFAFDHDAIDFLLKPISFKRFQRSLEKVADYQLALQALFNSENREEELFIKVKGSYVKINLDKLLYIQAKGDYVRLVLENKEYVIHSTLKNALSALPEKDFIKVHRSYAVNLNKIKDVTSKYVEVGDQRIAVSKSNREILRNRLNLS